uniref:Emerin isoform X2 n=1 Tax=Pogona vitticeps TaxID=103695 RepID=A0ABM5FQ84_9SAUR
MEKYKGLTDNELIAQLKKYSIPHGPIVGSTRKLYEKKVYEYETERTKLPSPRGTVLYTALGSTRTYLRGNYDSPRTEEYYSEYHNEDASPYLSHNYRSLHHEGRSSYTPEDRDLNSSETSPSSYRQYMSSLSSNVPQGFVSARQPIAEPYPYNAGQKDVSTERDSSSSYQSIFHRKSTGSSSLGVEPRRAIHTERRAQEAEKAAGSSAGVKRYFPFWPQLLIFLLLAGFLAFIYFFLQDGADDNPFMNYLKQ